MPRDYYEILGIPMEEDEATVRSAYYRRASRFHPDRHHASGDETVKDKLTTLFHAVNEAYRARWAPSVQAWVFPRPSTTIRLG